MQTTDTIIHEQFGFDGETYIHIQKEAIKERIAQFDERLYLEIGGKFLHDAHASRVLPGFFVDSKKRIFKELVAEADIIFCINARDIADNRQLQSDESSYMDEVMEMLTEIQRELDIAPFISINRISEENEEAAKKAKSKLKKAGYESFFRYEIAGYPQDTEKVFGKVGYARDQYIPVSKNLVLVTGAASSSGKMSTCLGQIFQEHNEGLDSGYAKYETFPIWNLELDHPVNLAYEAATADIGDYNILDSYHKNAYGEDSVNYNRDVEAFEIVTELAKQFLPADNYTRSYKSPTDMGINKAGFAITDDEVVKKAAIAEIKRRKKWYKEIAERGEGSEQAVKICQELIEKAKNG